MKIKASSALFIKLGPKGSWEKKCIEEENTIRLGFHNPHHEDCLRSNWEKVEEYWSKHKKTKGKITETVSQIKYFYESPEDTIWITFYNRKLYWCFAEKKVNILEDESRVRKVIGKWSSEDIAGNPLNIENLSGKLTKVQGFRGTICTVNEFDYLLKKINNSKLPNILAAENALINLKEKIKPLIQSLTWKDFELLVDLIFTAAGWQRISVIGKSEKDIDIELISPVNNKKSFVQIKSQSTFQEFTKYKMRFENMNQYDELYFVVHTPDQQLENYQKEKNIEVITVNRISELIINSGLVSWLIKKSS